MSHVPGATPRRSIELGRAIADLLATGDFPSSTGGKGDDAERISRDAEGARLLTRHLAGRQRGPVFLSDEAPSPGSSLRRNVRPCSEATNPPQPTSG